MHNGAPYAVNNYTLNNGSLVIGDTALNYGGGDLWNGGNAAALMLECASNTEIAVHDNVPYGATMIYLLSESHLSIHTFVDEGKVTIDYLLVL